MVKIQSLPDLRVEISITGGRSAFRYVTALPKRFWALWNYEHKKAAKRPRHFAGLFGEVFSAAPVRAEITAGQGCEKKSLRRMLEAGRF